MSKYRSENDIKINSFDLTRGKIELIKETNFSIVYGKKYCVVGKNGAGKTSFLRKLSQLDLSIDKYYVSQHINDSDKDIYTTVLESNEKRTKIKQDIDDLEEKMDNNEAEELDYEKHAELLETWEEENYDNDESLVSKILFGLGFSNSEIKRPVKEFSGGWKMKISLAIALYIQPTLLLLDEPTNHLDLNATIWLSNYLANWKKSLILVSHDTEFINSVCTDIIHIHQQSLNFYSSKNKSIYSSFLEQFSDKLNKQQKDYDALMKEIKLMKSKSKPKSEIDNYIKKHNVLRPEKEYKVEIDFLETNEITEKCVILNEINFSYGDKKIFDNLDFSIDTSSRITLVGFNGAGKTTLLKLIAKKIKPDSGNLEYDRRIKIGYFDQHSVDILDKEKTPIEIIHENNKELKVLEIRQLLGKIGLKGENQTKLNKVLSGGQKSRVVLLNLILSKPNLLLLDEPTNHLDLETIQSLSNAINNFSGGVLMVTHDVSLIKQTNSKIYEVNNGKIYETTYEDYENKIINNLD